MPLAETMFGMYTVEQLPCDRALHALFAAHYRQIRAISSCHLKHERADHTLQPTALAHEVFVRLLGDETLESINEADFLSLVSRAIRRILVDHARANRAAKRGGRYRRVAFDQVLDHYETRAIDLLELNDALEALALLDPLQAEIVDMRFFGGRTVEDLARVRGLSVSTIEREWRMARTWLFSRLRPET